MPTALVYPRRLLRESSNSWNIAGAAVAPGQTRSLANTVLRFDGGGLWVAEINDIYLADDEDALCFRAIRTACRGGAVPIVVPRLDFATSVSPTILGALVTEYAPVPHGDGALFSDGSGYYQPAIVANAYAAAALRATTITIEFMSGTNPIGGEAFSINHSVEGWRMYEISGVVTVSNTIATVTFDPPLRQAVPEDTLIEFDRPRCTMRLASTDAMNFRLETFPFARPSVKFIETFFDT